MFLASADATTFHTPSHLATHVECDHAPIAAVEGRDLVEWEMSAGQVGALVGAMALVFGLVWLMG